MLADSMLLLSSLPRMAQGWPSAGGRQDQAHSRHENDGWAHTCQRVVEGNKTGKCWGLGWVVVKKGFLEEVALVHGKVWAGGYKGLLGAGGEQPCFPKVLKTHEA